MWSRGSSEEGVWARYNSVLHADPGLVGVFATVIACAVGFPEIEAWCPQALGR